MAGSLTNGGTMDTIGTILNPRVSALLHQQKEQREQKAGIQTFLDSLNAPTKAPQAQASITQFMGLPASPFNNAVAPSPSIELPTRSEVPAFGGNNGLPGRFSQADLPGANQLFKARMVANAFPGAGEAIASSILAPPPSPIKLGKDEIIVDPITKKTLASNNVAEAPKIESIFDDSGRETRGYWKNGTFTKIGGSKADTGNDETWQNPVSEIDPATGKNIQVRYSNKGGRQVVANAVPARQGNAFDRADYWRGQFKPSLDSAQNATAQTAKIRNSLALGKGTGDIAAINALQKMIDEGGVVREQDVNLITGAQSLMSTLKTRIAKLETGDVLTGDLRSQLQATADALSNAIYSGVQARIEPYIPTMKGEGVEYENVVPEALRKTYKFDGGTPKPAAPQKPQGAPEDAKQAPDGNWYSPDPTRPGKYIKW